jgi:hypothetical protein
MMRCTTIDLLVRLRLIAFLSLSSLAFGVNAFQPLITEDADTLGRGCNQFELSVGQDQEKSDGETIRRLDIPLVFTRGLTDSLDVYAGAAYARIRPDATGNGKGISNPMVGAKWRFYRNEESKTSVALKPEILFPVSALHEEAGLGVGKTSGSLTLALTQGIGFGEIYVNAVIGRDRFRNTDIAHDVTYSRFSAAPVWEVTEEWQLALDAGAEIANGGGTRTYKRYAELAAIYLPSKDLDFSLGFIVATDNQSPCTTTYTPVASMSWRF